jgi:hypothetical protein
MNWIRKSTIFVAVFLTLGRIAFAQSPYPQCQNTSIGGTVACSMTIHVTSAITPIFARLSSRQYLFLENTGYTFSSGVPTVNQNAVFCSINSGNNPIANSAGGSNVIVIQPGGVYEPPQFNRPQSPFTVPSGDISCIAPLGDAWIAAEQE